MPAPAWPVISGRGVSKLNKAFQFMRGGRAPVGVDYTATRAPLPEGAAKGTFRQRGAVVMSEASSFPDTFRLRLRSGADRRACISRC